MEAAVLMMALLACTGIEEPLYEGASIEPGSYVWATPERVELEPVEWGELSTTTVEVTGLGRLAGITRSGDATFAVQRPDLPVWLSPTEPLRVTVEYRPERHDERAIIAFLHEDVDTPEAEVLVEGRWLAPVLEVDADTLDFGAVELDASATVPLTLRNVGDGTLELRAAVVDSDAFGPGGWEAPLPTLAPGEEGQLDVSFAPAELGAAEATLTLEWAHAEAPFSVVLVGEGLVPTSTHAIDVTVEHRRTDVAFLVDTSAMMAPHLGGVGDAFAAVASDLGSRVSDVTFGVATFEDYRDPPFGTEASRPYRIEVQQTHDHSRLAAVLAGLEARDGGDALSSGMEALHQLGTGRGYDDCDGSFEVGEVRPFVASPDDAFRGLTPGAFDPAVPGTGERGGLGFREVAPVVVVATNATFRDPGAGDEAPGGCPRDADSFDAVSAMGDLGARVIGIDLGAPDAGVDQLTSLAVASDAFGDLDGDGVADPLVLDASDGVDVDALVDLLASLAEPAVYASVTVAIDDPAGVVVDLAPRELRDVQAGDPWPYVLTVRGDVLDAPTTETVEVHLEWVADASAVVHRETVHVRP